MPQDPLIRELLALADAIQEHAAAGEYAHADVLVARAMRHPGMDVATLEGVHSIARVQLAISYLQWRVAATPNASLELIPADSTRPLQRLRRERGFERMPTARRWPPPSDTLETPSQPLSAEEVQRRMSAPPSQVLRRPTKK